MTVYQRPPSLFPSGGGAAAGPSTVGRSLGYNACKAVPLSLSLSLSLSLNLEAWISPQGIHFCLPPSCCSAICTPSAEPLFTKDQAGRGRVRSQDYCRNQPLLSSCAMRYTFSFEPFAEMVLLSERTVTLSTVSCYMKQYCGGRISTIKKNPRLTLHLFSLGSIHTSARFRLPPHYNCQPASPTIEGGICPFGKVGGNLPATLASPRE